MPLFLAVDAGGTTTTYVLADEVRELARTEGGSIKRLRVPAPVAQASLAQACADLSAQSGIDLRTVTRTCIGAAGFSVPLVADWLTEAFAPKVGGELLLLGDVEIALDAAFQGRRGVLVLAGTGSNVAGRTADGRLTGAGGWGPVVGDEGSGFSIGRDAVRAVFRAEDAGESTMMASRIQGFWGVDLRGLCSRVNTQPPADFASLVPQVVEAAAAGDMAALGVLQHAGTALAETTLLALARLQRMEGAASPALGAPAPVALAGSILRHVPQVRDALVARLRLTYPDLPVSPDVVEPVQGALWRARREADSPGFPTGRR